jgi:hypothetical protein
MFPSSRDGVADSANSINLAMIAGSDEYIGTMTLISSAETTFANTVQATDGVGVTGKAYALPWSVGGASLN